MPEKEKPIWAQRIATVRKRLKLNQKTLADMLATTQSNVSKWETGEYKPSPSQFMHLAELAQGGVEELHFMELGGVPASYFLGDSSNPKKMVPIAVAEHAIRQAEEKSAAELVASGYLSENASAIRHVPLLKDASAAGTPRAVDDNEIEDLIALPRKWTGRGGELYLIKVDGDSMSPILESGYQALVDTSLKSMEQLDRQIVLARVGDGVTIKFLRKDGDTYMLVPNNLTHRHPIQIIRPDGDVSIIGHVCMWIGHSSASRKK